jgi:predicted ArsR family transcriptional regulator
MTETEMPGLAALARVATLDDPVRQRLYGFIVDRCEPVSRDQAATAAGIGRTLAAYHLDKLAEAGLLTTHYQRPEGRRGAGAGRPAKLYTKAADELAISVPPRDYELLARLLVDAVERDAAGAVRAEVEKAAFTAGRATGRDAGTALAALHRCGYQPQVDERGEVTLVNCPFHRIAQESPELVCRLNLRLVKGILAGAGDAATRARLAPRSGRCCVTIRPPGAHQPA